MSSLDDANVGWERPGEPGALTRANFAMKQTKVIAQSIIDKLGSQDLASIIFTRDNRYSQDFTNDRSRLRAAVDHFSLGFTAKKMYDFYAVKAIREAAESLIAVPGRRKALIDISRGAQTSIFDRSTTGTELMHVFQDASRANVNVHTIDPTGLQPDTNPYGTDTQTKARLEFLQTVAEETGGHAIVNTNDPEPGVQQIFRETSSYYLLGYEASDIRKNRHVEVLVDRPGATVVARHMTYAVKAEKPADGAPPTKPALAMSGVLPMSDLPMRLTAAPFAIEGSKNAAVIVAASVREPAQLDAKPGHSEDVEVQVRAFTVEGLARGVVSERAHAVSAANAAGDIIFDVPARIDLPPGKYEIRVGVHSPRVDKDASVYTIVDVPDFSEGALLLSGVVVHSDSAVAAESIAALASISPVVPTTLREFRSDDDVQTFVRVYQGGREPLKPVTVRTRILNDHDGVVSDWTRTVPPAAFGTARAADVRDRLRLSDLSPGRYLLTIEAGEGAKTQRRTVQFAVGDR